MRSDDPAQLSRGSFNAIGAKLDDMIDSFRIDSETKSRAQVLAHEAGMSLSEWLRLRVQGAVWGPDHVASVHAERIKRVLGNVR